MTSWIVFPMAGLSERFTRAGYAVPKYMLSAHGRTLFRHAVEGFIEAAGSMRFLFIARDVQDTPAFIRSECAALGLAEVDVHVLAGPTRGQGETVALGLADRVDDGDSIYVFNIDTFRPHWRPPVAFDAGAVDGYLEVFRGEGANWSFVAPREPGQRVARTTEKEPISDLCCTGLYHFRRAGDFREAADAAMAAGPAAWSAGELYVAPLYNRLIAAGRDIRYHLIGRDEVVFCGTPDEYHSFLAREA